LLQFILKIFESFLLYELTIIDHLNQSDGMRSGH